MKMCGLSPLASFYFIIIIIINFFFFFFFFFLNMTTATPFCLDASNAFNSLNRAAALHNIRVLCPSIATYAINTYREPSRLFIFGGQELRSSEGTTQGDPFAMSLYAISLQPLISRLQVKSAASQCWYADDATGCGSLGDVKTWWDELMVSGPPLGKNVGSL